MRLCQIRQVFGIPCIAVSGVCESYHRWSEEDKENCFVRV